MQLEAEESLMIEDKMTLTLDCDGRLVCPSWCTLTLCDCLPRSRSED